jgi:26S proteasome regulatory subunit N10
MVLEATILCLDNSEYSRNGDYIPSRLDVQCDAANIICGTKTNMNPENSIGLLTAAGDR